MENVLSASWATKRALKDAFEVFVKRFKYWWFCRRDWRTIDEFETM